MLPQAVDASDALFEYSRVPRKIKVDDQRSGLQIQSRTTRIGGEKDPALAVGLKALHHPAPLLRRYSTMQVLESYMPVLQFFRQQAGHPFPLAEHHHLSVRSQYQVVNDIHRLVYLNVVTGLLVKDIRAVAHHSHHVQAEQQPATVHFGEEMMGLPLMNQPGHCLPILLMNVHLLLGDRDEQVLVLALRQLQTDITLAAAYQPLPHPVTDGIQVLIAHHFPRLVGHD